jgi:hypothetical protein
MGIPEMHDYVVEVMTGKTKEQVGDWIDHSLRNHLLPMLERVTTSDSQSDERGISADLFVNRANISKDGQVEREFDVPLIEECKDGDPSEAPRSADLRTLLFATFPVIEVLPMGGTLLRPLLAHRAGNFRSDSDFCILRLISLIERELIRTRGIQSDNLYSFLGEATGFR